MNTLKASLIAAFVATVVLCPRGATAMSIEMFDSLMDEDQREYLEYLVDVTRNVLTEMNQKDQAEKVEDLFESIPPGESQSLGRVQFRDNLEGLRRFAAEHPRGPLRFDVEDAMLQTLATNGIRVPRQFQRSLEQHLREKPYWPRLPIHKS
jgi:hypothetical protein